MDIRKQKIMLKLVSLLFIFTLMGIVLHSKFSYESPVIKTDIPATTRTAIMAGGCFWCVEADFEKLNGIVAVVSGYAGGYSTSPNYQNYAQGGYREVVEVTYDPEQITYQDLVEHNIFYSDPTDNTGSFHDRGIQYSPAIYYENDQEKEVVRSLIDKINSAGIYNKPINIDIRSKINFYPAEEYHQDYSKKNPLRYKFYRASSGRDKFIQEYIVQAIQKGFLLNIDKPLAKPVNLNFDSYQKPSDDFLKNNLTSLQYEVTQEEETEKPFENEYDTNKEDGIYADRISGEPLFSSSDKYDSGTGWPSFVKPIADDYLVLRQEKKLFVTRTEVRSRYGDSHLGHVFDDGPANRGGKRYCMNSAALVFIPKEIMEGQGYGNYLYLFQ